MENISETLFNTQIEKISKILKILSDDIQDSILPFKASQEEISKIMKSALEPWGNFSKSIANSLIPFREALEELSQRQAEIFSNFKTLDILQSSLTAKLSEDVENIYSSIIDSAIEDGIIIKDDIVVENLKDSINKKPITWRKYFEVLFGLITIITFIQGFLPDPKPEPIKEYTNYLEKLVNIESQQLENQNYDSNQINELKIQVETLSETLNYYIQNQTQTDESSSHTQGDSIPDKTPYHDFDQE